MTLRNSLGNVLKENGIVYGTDLKKLREYSAGNFEGMDSELDFGMDTLSDNVQMGSIENEGFMSDELPKFVLGGIIKKAKDYLFAPAKTGKFLTSSYTKPFVTRNIPGSGGILTRGWNSFKNSSFGSSIANKYNALKTKGGASTLIGGIINKVKENLPKGIFNKGKGTGEDVDVGFKPMEFQRFRSKAQLLGRQQDVAGKADNMRGKYYTTAMAQAISPITNPKAAQLVANFNLTALNSPVFKGTAIGITKRPSSALTAPGTQTVNIDAVRPMEQIKIT